MLKRNKFFITFFIIILSLQQAHALKSDKTKPLYIKSDSAELLKNKGVSTYTGNVVITQGTTHSECDVAKLYFDNPKDKHPIATKIECYGNKTKQASYSTLPAEDKARFTATADLLTYFIQRNISILKGNAKAVQGNDEKLSGNQIYYDAANNIIRTSSLENKDQTEIIINPVDDKDTKN